LVGIVWVDIGMITVAIYTEEDNQQSAKRPVINTLDTSECKIGRNKSNDVVLDDPSVSPEHARIYRENDGYFICDMKSGSGTFIQGFRLPAMHKIKMQQGTVVNIGRHNLRLESDAVQADDLHRNEVGDNDSVAIGYAKDKNDRRSKYFKDPRMFKLKAEVHQQLLDIIELRRLDFNKTNDEDLRKQCHKIVRKILSDSRYASLNDLNVQVIIKDILDEALGLGPLEEFLADDDITEIMVNRPDRIYIEKKGKIRRSRKIFSNTKSVQRIITRIVGPLGRRIDESSPMVDARLADGSRVNVVIPPLALDGPCLTIRKFAKIPLTVEDVIRYKSINRAMVDFIKTCVVNRKNILIAGGTGSGKTTALNVFSSFIPEGERVVTIEDAAELQLPQDHVIRLESRPANIEGRGEITIRHLVKNSLRMRPDRIIIGECRSGETLDMLQAMNTGHDGSITTIHANSPKDVVSRLETMVLQAGTDLSSRAIREQIASALDIVIQQMRFSCGARKITNISEVVGMEGDQIILQDIFYFKQLGIDSDGKTIGSFLATGWIPQFYEALQDSGAQTDMSIFHN
jgi:pilus assembly protein CpaF